MLLLNRNKGAEPFNILHFFITDWKLFRKTCLCYAGHSFDLYQGFFLFVNFCLVFYSADIIQPKNNRYNKLRSFAYLHFVAQIKMTEKDIIQIHIATGI